MAVRVAESVLGARVLVVGWAVIDPGQRKLWLEEVQRGLGLDEMQAWVLGVTEVGSVWQG